MTWGILWWILTARRWGVVVELDGTVHDCPDVAAYDRERETFLCEQFGVRFVRLTNGFVLSADEAEIRAVLFKAMFPQDKASEEGDAV